VHSFAGNQVALTAQWVMSPAQSKRSWLKAMPTDEVQADRHAIS